jgi:multiple sugar transport system ATP-binding protein
MSTLELKQLSKVHPDGTEAVAGIDLALEDGEFFVLVGPSGCGKTSVLRMVAGLEPVTAGDVLVDGVRVNDVPARATWRWCSGQRALPASDSQENIGFALRIAKVGKRQIQRQVAETAAAATNRCARPLPAQLSGGQQQRAAMGRDRAHAAPLADGRADVEPRCQVANRARFEDRGSAPPRARHDALCHARSGRGDGDGRSGGGDARRPDRAVRHADQLYDHPVDLFVAQFIGMPPMNVVTATVIARGCTSRADRFAHRRWVTKGCGHCQVSTSWSGGASRSGSDPSRSDVILPGRSS